MESLANLETSKEGMTLVPPVIINADITSFPTKYRLKKPLSRLSLATDRFSCVSFMTSSHRSDLSVGWIPRWRSLPNYLQDEEHYCDDDPEILSVWSKYRITNMARRYKTMDYINVMIESDSDVMCNGEAGCDLSTIVGLSVSRDFLDCRPDNSDNGSGIVPRSSSDEHLYCSHELDGKQDLTEANVTFALASSRTCSCENLDPGHKNVHKIQKWLQRCYFRPPQAEIAERDKL